MPIPAAAGPRVNTSEIEAVRLEDGQRIRQRAGLGVWDRERDEGFLSSSSGMVDFEIGFVRRAMVESRDQRAVMGGMAWL